MRTVEANTSAEERRGFQETKIQCLNTQESEGMSQKAQSQC